MEAVMAEEKRTGVERYLTLTLGDEFFALDIYSVREILDMTEITRIPQTPHFMSGVVNVRGNAVPVIDLRLKFGMPPGERTLNTRIVIMEIGDGETVTAIGAIADSVKEVLELETDKIDPPPRMGMSVGADFIKGIGKRDGKFVLILDVEKVFTSDEILSLKQVEESLSGGASGDDDDADLLKDVGGAGESGEAA
jgi:purine-binding chemotaxis protein CheW